MGQKTEECSILLYSEICDEKWKARKIKFMDERRTATQYIPSGSAAP